EEMLVAQFGASAMLFPFLLRDARCCVAMIVTAAPMLQLAAILSMTPSPRVVGAWTCLSIWLAALAGWRTILPARHRPRAVAMANLLSIGGLILWYLAREFTVPPGEPSLAHGFPLVATLRFVQGSGHFSLPLCSTAFLAILGIVV